MRFERVTEVPARAMVGATHLTNWLRRCECQSCWSSNSVAY